MIEPPLVEQAEVAILDCLRDELIACRRRLKLCSQIVSPLERELEAIDTSDKTGQRLATQLEIRLMTIDHAQRAAWRRLAELTTTIDEAIAAQAFREQLRDPAAP